MKKYTKLFIGTLCFLSSAAVFAGGCRTDLKGEVLMPVTIPTLDGGANVSAGALYMQPYSSNVDYLATYTDVDGGSNYLYNWQHYRVDPNFKCGFTVLANELIQILLRNKTKAIISMLTPSTNSGR